MREPGGDDIGFLAALFDFSFTEFVSVRLVRLLYAVALIAGVLGAVISVVMAFSRGFLEGIFGLVFAPVALLLWLLAARVWLEFVVVAFRIADHVKEIAENTKKQ